MENRGIFTNAQEIEIIRQNLKKYDWYGESFRNIKQAADTALKKGLSVPEESGFVFYETCPRDDAALIFDPFNPRDHICPKCGMNYKDQCYQKAWVTQKHSWLSQIAVLIGIVYAVEKDEAYAKALRQMFLDYLKYYPDYPNNDNELGPTKVFQSTYIESVWLTYLAGAYDMVEGCGCFATHEREAIRHELFRASANVIKDYDERMNNRQAFNNAALISAGFILEDNELVEYALNGPHGFVRHMEESVLEDGLWYEGDNYHFATVPSMVNIAEACRHNGIDLYEREFNGHTIRMLFDAPLKSLQPDLTFPSRKDSRFANHFAQKWYAGLYELAYSRYGSPSYAKILKQIYAFESNENQSFANAAGIMEIFKAQVSRRSNLDWRGFLNAAPDLGDGEGLPFTCSVNMRGTGLAVIRKGEGKLYTSLDYGKYGGGHGHPDRLNISLFYNGHRLLTDWGTGNYYFDHLNWYRSTIAHNTLVVDGSSQVPVEGTCTIFEETPEVSAMSAAVPGIFPGVIGKRTVIAMEKGLLFDFMEAESKDVHRYHYVLHSYGKLELNGLSPGKAKLDGENYRFLNNISGIKTEDAWSCAFKNKEYDFIVRMDSRTGTTVYRAEAYGPPDKIPQLFPVLIVERNSSSTQYAALMETVENGKDSFVDSFEKTGELTYRINCKGEKSYELGKSGEGWYVLAFEKGSLKSISSFKVESVEGCFSSTVELKTFFCRLGEKVVEIVTQPFLGEILLYDHNAYNGCFSNKKIVLNGNTVEAETAGSCTRIRSCESLEGTNAGQATLCCAGEVKALSVAEPLEIEEYISRDNTGCVVINLKNVTHQTLRVQCSLHDGEILIPGQEQKKIIVAADSQYARMEDTVLSIPYTVCVNEYLISRCYSKVYAKAEYIEPGKKISGVQWKPAVFMTDRSQVRRGERHWGGPEDLSAEAMLFSHDSGLVFRILVRDDKILFSGGKFFFDNDCIQVYFDRRQDKYRNIPYITTGVYGFVLSPGINGEASTVRTVGFELNSTSNIGISTHINAEGYEIFLDIPWDVIGGKPCENDIWGFDTIVNDRDSGVRRDLQMVWSGCFEDERIYLMQQNHNPLRFGLLFFK